MGVGVLEHMVLSALADHYNLVESALVGIVGSGPPALQAAAEWTVHSRLQSHVLQPQLSGRNKTEIYL